MSSNIWKLVYIRIITIYNGEHDSWGRCWITGESSRNSRVYSRNLLQFLLEGNLLQLERENTGAPSPFPSWVGSPFDRPAALGGGRGSESSNSGGRGRKIPMWSRRPELEKGRSAAEGWPGIARCAAATPTNGSVNFICFVSVLLLLAKVPVRCNGRESNQISYPA
jgi:hypothetical protein